VLKVLCSSVDEEVLAGSFYGMRVCTSIHMGRYL